MLKIKEKKKNKTYDFKYKINWLNGRETNGNIKNSVLPPETIFLNNKVTYFSNGTCTYFNEKEIQSFETYDLVEKVEG